MCGHLYLCNVMLDDSRQSVDHWLVFNLCKWLFKQS
jgi:hypothetical protein